MNTMTKTASPADHELAKQSYRTFAAAREGLEKALEHLGRTNYDDIAGMRLAMSGVVAASDALKGAANAYSNILGHLSRGVT